MTAASVPREVAAGEIVDIPGIVLPCAVLSDGRRVLSTRGVVAAFGYKHTGSAAPGNRAPELPPFLASNALKPFISADLTVRLKSPIEYRKGALGVRRRGMGDAAAVILDALVGVAMVALVDSATGYERVRPPRELERQLGALIADQTAAWQRTFTEPYYRELCRLRGVEYHPTRRPRYFGTLTNDIVYSRIAPGVLAKLREKNPIDDDGRRATKHHQWLTRDLGHPALREHLALVVGFMRLSSTWDSLIERLDHVVPHQRTNLYLLSFDQMQAPSASGMNEERPCLL